MASTASASQTPPAVRDLGRMAYGPAWDEQKRLHADVLAGTGEEAILLVEHEPVVTIGRHPGAAEHLTAAPELLERMGVEVCQTNRGGDITYHGPGQIVAYPIIRLQDRKLNLRRYVKLLEQAIIDTLAAFGIEAERDPEAIGVWVSGPAGLDGTRQAAKIAAIGVRAQRWVTMHGLALNVDPNLEHFKLIVPCGLTGRPVTSMRQQLGEACPAMDRVKATLTERLLTLLGYEL